MLLQEVKTWTDRQTDWLDLDLDASVSLFYMAGVHPYVQQSCTRAAPLQTTVGLQEAPWLLHTSHS